MDSKFIIACRDVGVFDINIIKNYIESKDNWKLMENLFMTNMNGFCFYWGFHSRGLSLKFKGGKFFKTHKR